MIERFWNRYPKTTTFLAVLFVVLMNGIGGMLD